MSPRLQPDFLGLDIGFGLGFGGRFKAIERYSVKTPKSLLLFNKCLCDFDVGCNNEWVLSAIAIS